ncbi:MAG: hypothetical protein ACI9C2_002046 [Gammaproteobacteria bacterium]|jgi:hypothetical protein
MPAGDEPAGSQPLKLPINWSSLLFKNRFSYNRQSQPSL